MIVKEQLLKILEYYNKLTVMSKRIIFESEPAMLDFLNKHNVYIVGTYEEYFLKIKFNVGYDGKKITFTSFFFVNGKRVKNTAIENLLND